MKIRNGFVSNSSSCSFTCDVCGEKAEGWDLDIVEAEMAECESGHTFCMGHSKFDVNEEDLTKEQCVKLLTCIGGYSDELEEIKNLKTDKDWKNYKELNSDLITEYIYEAYNSVPAEFCPICSLEVLSLNDGVEYFIKGTGITKHEVFNHIKQKNKRRKKLKNNDYYAYVKEKVGLSKEDLEKDLKTKFKTYDELHKYLYEN